VAQITKTNLVNKLSKCGNGASWDVERLPIVTMNAEETGLCKNAVHRTLTVQ
jgi:hypothetical protein